MPLRRPFRDSFDGGDFCESEATEELQIDNLREQSIGFGKFVQGFTDLGELVHICDILNFGAERGDLESATALLGVAAACG